MRALTAVDEAVKQVVRNGSIEEQATREGASRGLKGSALQDYIDEIKTAPSKDMLRTADDLAHRVTYQDALPSWAGWIQRGFVTADP
jgi:hypothetical protein